MQNKYNIESLIKYAKLAKLAPSDLSPNEEERISEYLSFFKEKDFNEIVEMIEKSLEVDVSSVGPDLLMFGDQKTLFRNDSGEKEQRNSKFDILKNSKNQNGDYYISPKIIE
jgi:aspartyl/glutamyl-tRNA(Asn/Gln) amidotransferase C subunit